ncbi:MAG: FtsX-like permease family protein [Acidobacteria bacterium]|nr:FtsX-like permease family protein [Acidobacteriota bacterium]
MRLLAQDYRTLPVTTAEDRFGQGRATPVQLNYRARSLEEVELAEEQLREGLRRARGLPDHAEDDFQILSLDALLSSVRGVMVAVVTVGVALAAISLLAGGIGVMNVMLVVLRERSREIGIRKAIGAGHSQLVAQFLIEAVLLSLAGGVLGAGIGAALRLLAPAFAPSLPLGAPPFTAYAVAFLFSVSVGVVFGIYPAVVAARRDPWSALRSE